MKQLQNNFTTPEQSKRLLELGVPADSADCVLENLDTAENNFQSEDYTRWIIEKRHVKEDIFCERNEGIFLPCWSAGRLIEISLICGIGDIVPNELHIYKYSSDSSLVENLINRLETIAELSDIDFSNLED